MSQPPTTPPPAGLLLADDLLFSSRVTGTAGGLGLVVRPARTVEALLSLAAKHPPRCVLLDLGFPGLMLGDLLAQLRAACAVMPRVVAYGSHVDAAGLKAARDAGCEPVLPRSKFVEDLSVRLPEWLAGD